MSFIKDILTEDDANSVYCYVRVLSVIGFMVLVGMLIYKGLFGGFDIEASARGLGEYLAGSGAAIWGKTKSGA